MKLVKLFFQQTISPIKDYYHHFFNDKPTVLLNYIIDLLILSPIITTSFVLRTQAINFANSNSGGGYYYYQVHLNSGISFGWFGDKPWLVYFFQIVTVLISFLFMLHCRQWILSIGVSTIFAGGLANLIDRIIFDPITNQDGNHTVVDYWRFFFIFWQTFINLPDIFITLGIGWIIIYSLWKSYYQPKTTSLKNQVSSKIK